MKHKALAQLVTALILALGLTTFIMQTLTLYAQVPAPVLQPLPTDQIIIKYKPSAVLIGPNAPAAPERMAALSQIAGVPLTYFREMSGNAHVLKLPDKLLEDEVRRIATKLMTLPEVEYAEPDSIMQIGFTPNDPLYGQQWHYFSTFGINLPAAWDVTTGSSNLVIAVIDTGILPNHPDIVGRILQGYDMISNGFTANDGDGRDNDPTDPGDWVTLVESNTVPGCGLPNIGQQNSSWHGTHVAGTIGAASNNGVGVAGINWVSRILPVRVLGKCGGSLSDIADGISWAAGLNVPGVPTNANPARVLNLSLGGTGSCSTTYQNAIDAARNTGAVIVVAAGNSNQNASNQQPANCNGVITVAATNQSGNKAGFSNFGSIVKISAPGTAVLSTMDTGITAPVASTYGNKNGTSQATPHVAGVASLMLSMRPTLNPTDVVQIIQLSASPFPLTSTCTTITCGTGIINAANAVSAFFVDQNYSGLELGTPAKPFKSVGAANNAAWNGAWISIKAGSYAEVLTLNKKMTLRVDGGVVTIGQ